MTAGTSLLVAGGAGFIGSCFVALAVRNGARVVVLDALTYAGGRDNLEAVPSGPGSFELVVGNICDGELVARLLRQHSITQVVNFAAESHVDNSILGPKPFIETNIGGTFQMLEAVRGYDRRVRFLQVSTDEVYGSLGDTGAFTEASAFAPNSPYSATKAAADHLVRAWGKTYGMDVVSTHCSNNYGPRQHPEKLVPTMILAAVSGKPLPLYGDGQQVRDWIHVEDHCEGLWLALTKGVPDGVYHFGGGEERTNNVMVAAICGLLDQMRPLASGSYVQQMTHVADRPGHDRRYAIDDSVTRKALGFAPKRKFGDALRDTVAWYLDNMAWCEKRRKA